MKFGKNLASLSIPEWKVYNLDYNDLKASIRNVTSDSSKAALLTELYHKFVENFDYVNLFLLTKTGELERKLRSFKAEFELALNSQQDPATTYHALVALHYHVINDISLTVKKLMKYILVQKIALKKIFKKLTKHYPDPAKSKQFVATLSHVLYLNPRSFVNFDLSPLSAELAVLLKDIERETNTMHSSLQRKLSYTPNGQLKRNHSYTTVSSCGGGAISEESSLYENLHVEYSVNQLIKFDLVCAIKKNFDLHCLLPKDLTSSADLALFLDVFLNLQKLKGATRVSVIYLTQDAQDANPSYLVSYEDQQTSVLVAYTGGLRKYSYCCLPNDIAEGLLQYMLSEDDDTQIKAENLLLEYLLSNQISSMTKPTISALVSNNAKPSLKLVCDRTRYFLHKNASQHNDVPTHELNSALVSPLSPDPRPQPSEATSTVDTRDYEDNFYMLHDENIFTSHEVSHSILFDIEGMDPFPFNKFSIHSNGPNLYDYHESLKTTITGTQIECKSRPVSHRKLPVKIQNFLLNSLVHPFRNFSIYDYMRSCYFNFIPSEQNNHYLVILNINLLKNYENVDYVRNQNALDENLIQDKAKVILNRQKSYSSMQKYFNPDSAKVQTKTKDAGENDTSHSMGLLHQFDSDYIQRMQSLSALENVGNDDFDNYFWYLQHGIEIEDSFLNNVIMSFIRSRMRLSRSFSVFRRFSYPFREKGIIDSDAAVSYYGSVEDDPLYYSDEGDYQVRFVNDYDATLSFIYFILCFTSLFISGINFGIIFGILRLQQEDIQLSNANNVFIFIMLVFGFLFALIFSMVSINLNLQRLRHSPVTHSTIIWTGFFVVTASIVWTIIMIFT